MSTCRLLQLLCLVPVMTLALEANGAFFAPQFKHLPGRRTVLIHTGNAALDDAVEEGFRLHWKITPWSWAADTGMPKPKGDSSLYVFGNFPLHRWRVQGFGCQGGWKDNRKGGCILQDSASSFSLHLVEEARSREILSEISELRSWPKGDVMAVDVVRDFNTALQAANDPTLDSTLLSRNDEWPGLVASAVGRQSCPACTVWVAREYGVGKSLDAGGMSSLLARPVEIVGMDTLEGFLGKARQGLYLDAGARSTFTRNLHLRTLDSGILAATMTRRISGDDELPAGLDDGDLSVLGHRLRGDERRVVFSLSWFGEYTGNTLAHFVQGGYEFRRGWHALAGYGTTYELLLANSIHGPKLGTLLGGVRWSPKLGYEARALTSRIVLDATLQLPLEDDKQAMGTWNAPAVAKLTATANLAFLDIGAGIRIPFGDEYGIKRIVMGYPMRTANSNWSLRLGIRTEWRGWRKAPSLFTPAAKLPTSTTSSAAASSVGP